jgi:hypothetical protein
VSSEGDTLFMQKLDKPKEQLFTEAGDLFFHKGVEGRLLFRRDAQDRRNNEDIIWRKSR